MAEMSHISAHDDEYQIVDTETKRLQTEVKGCRERLTYLLRIYKGEPLFWMNTYEVKPAMLEAPLDHPTAYLLLAQSIERCLCLCTSFLEVHDYMIQVFEEYAHFLGGSFQYLKAASTTSVDSHLPREATNIGPPGLVRFSGQVVYQALTVMHVPYDLSPRRVTAALLSALERFYGRLERFYGPEELSAEMLMRLDGKVKQHVVIPITKKLNGLVMADIRAIMAELRGEQAI